MLEILFFVPGESPYARRFEFGKYTIGRALTADIRLRHDSVAERHALLSIENSQAVFKDLGAPDSVRRNGVVVSRLAPVREGDTFEIGDCEIRIIGAPDRDQRAGAAPLRNAQPHPQSPQIECSEAPTRALAVDLPLK